MSNAELIITASAFSILLYFAVLLWTMRPRKKIQLPKSAYHQELGRAGDSQRRYKPKRNLNRVINRLVSGEVKAFPPSAVIVQQKQYPDVSFWQGLIGWDAMRAKTDAVIIRAGQNTWIDSMFAVNYAAAKMRGMLRGVYWFYDDRVSPGVQAAKLAEALGNDAPEMEIWCDWERSYGGSFGGLRNVVAFMEAVERAYPSARVGMYTGYYWFMENSNAILNLFQYEYLRKKPLWLAWYTANAAQVLVPAPWTRLDLWQFGTPAVDWGQASAEIDMNVFNGTISEFYQRYAGAEPEPPDEGEPMKQYRIVWDKGANERVGPSAWDTWNGTVHAKGAVINVVGVVVKPMGYEEWGKLENGNYVALIYGGTLRAEPVLPTEPPAEPTFPAEFVVRIGTAEKTYILKP